MDYFETADYNLILDKGEYNVENKLYLGSRPGIIKNFEDGNPLQISTIVSALPVHEAQNVGHIINSLKPNPEVILNQLTN